MERLRTFYFKDYGLTTEGLTERVRGSRREDREIGTKFAESFGSLLYHWAYLSEGGKGYERLCDLFLTEHLLKRCSPKFALSLWEPKAETLADLSDLAGKYLEAQKDHKAGTMGKEKKRTRRKTAGSKLKRSTKGANRQKLSAMRKSGHLAADCRGRFVKNSRSTK